MTPAPVSRDLSSPQGEQFKQEADKVGLVLSGKAEIVASEPWIAKALSRALKTKGVTASPALRTRDLGVSYTAGKLVKSRKFVDLLKVTHQKRHLIYNFMFNQLAQIF